MPQYTMDKRGVLCFDTQGASVFCAGDEGEVSPTRRIADTRARCTHYHPKRAMYARLHSGEKHPPSTHPNLPFFLLYFSSRRTLFFVSMKIRAGGVWVFGRVRVDSVCQAMNGGLKRTPSWARISSYENLQVTREQVRARATSAAPLTNENARETRLCGGVYGPWLIFCDGAAYRFSCSVT